MPTWSTFVRRRRWQRLGRAGFNRRIGWTRTLSFDFSGSELAKRTTGHAMARSIWSGWVLAAAAGCGGPAGAAVDSLTPTMPVVQPAEAAPAAVHTYEALLAIHRELLDLREPRSTHGLADYRAATVAGQVAALEALRRRLDALEPKGWARAEQVDFVLVRSMFDQYEFMLRVARPWARDPGFYVDPLLKAAFTSLPVHGEDRTQLTSTLDAVAETLSAAERDLTTVAADYAMLAAHNLRHADGVGHGHPYRAEPPAGVIGWYEDLRQRAEKTQPNLVRPIERAQAAIEKFAAWLESNRFTGRAGVGRNVYDWYLRHVKLMPFRSAQLRMMGRREIDRLQSLLTLERHRNRSLPPLTPAATADDYAARIKDADRDIRAWLKSSEILTVPDDIGELDTNAPWIVRPTGRNFWEEIQFRDPRPDHVHAVIPGHRFDWIISERQAHPIRQKYWDAGRVEGWAVYLEEMAMQTGLLADRPRTRELFYIFGLKRATRVIVDIDMQLNRMTVDDAVRYMRERVPYLDEAVARVDAEIYIRRPPGYGLSYSIGKLQMERLLAKRAQQLGDDFVLRAFHDRLLSLGRIPVALLAWQMTGDDADARPLLNSVRLSRVLNRPVQLRAEGPKKVAADPL